MSQSPDPALDAVLFDMDGVVTDTATVHAAAWKALFDPFLARRGDDRPFTEEEYRLHVDGKPRLDGVRDFLASRGIALPEGNAGDDPETETVHGLGNRKNGLFRAALAEGGAEAFPGSLALLDALEAAGIRTAIFSASRNAEAVLASAGILGRFAVRIDGAEAARLGLPGKPDPAVLVEAARRLGVEPARAAVIEDAVAGVEAGRAGAFAQVVGVDREGHAVALRAAGADVVVADLAELDVSSGRLAVRTFGTIPHIWEAEDALARRLAGRRPAVFLDYDGVLSPIVPDPAAAVLSAGMRAALDRLAARVPVAIVSGRDLDDVRGFVTNEQLYFAGSHGFDLAGPEGWRQVVDKGRAFLPALADSAAELEAALAAVPGARVERKRFSLAVHFRQVAAEDEPRVAAILHDVMARQPRLKASAGKKVFDVKPRVDWNKGRAVLSLLAELGLAGDDVVPIYLGDDTTDEDAFRAIAGRGVGIVVRDGSDRRTAATFAVDSTEEVERLLGRLAEMVAS